MKIMAFGFTVVLVSFLSLTVNAAVHCSQYSTDGQLCETWSNGVSCARYSTDGQLCETWSNGVTCSLYSTDGQVCEKWSNGVKCSRYSTDGQICELWSNGSECARYSPDGQLCEVWSGNGPFASAKSSGATTSAKILSPPFSRNRDHFHRHDGFCTAKEYEAGMSTHENLIMLTYYPYCDF